MRVFTTVPQHDLRRVPAAAREAEAQRYDGIIAMENQHDPFLALAVAGAATERVELHTGVAIAFARTPMAVAQVGWDLAGSTGGRFVKPSVKFYLTAILFVVFDVEIVFMYPWAALFKGLGWVGFASMLGFIVALLVALAYCWKKGALEWER